MPTITPKFQIGDTITHYMHGTGIIISKPHLRDVHDIPMQFYHVAIPGKRFAKFGYYAKLKLSEPATKESTEKANNILIQTTKTKPDSKFEIGDKVVHPKYGNGIILGNMHTRGSKQYYHVYYPDTETYGYNASFFLISHADQLSKQLAKTKLFDNLLLIF